MSPGLIKGILVTGIVFGCESQLWAVYYWLRYRHSTLHGDKRHSSTSPSKHLARGALLILLFAPSYYLFTLGLVGESATIVVMLAFSAGTLLLEILFQGGFAKFFSREAMKAETWNERKISKGQAVLAASLGVTIVAVEIAVVFSIVSPEVLALHWWIVLVLTISLLSMGFAIWQWNAWEKKFGSDTVRSNQ